MLNIHFGRENLNKERYMFDNIRLQEGKVLLLVPDQFTLMAEKEAFFYLETKGMMDFEVLSFSRLGTRILTETGGSKKAHIDASGRYMLITKLVAESKDNFKLFKNSSELASFAQLANDLIYEMKQYNTTPADILTLTQSIEDDLILKQKLEDIHRLYSKYETYTKEKYLDGEDYIELFTSKISESKLVTESALWIYGFDYFTPKNMDMLKELMKHSREMNMVMTYSDAGKDRYLFELTGGVIEKMKQLAKQNGIEHQEISVPDTYIEEKREALIAVEKELFAIPGEICANAEGITLVKSANLYNEMETAAAYVLKLVREHGLRYKDIAMICNDLDERASIAKRIFSQYGIELFIDQKRSFMHNAAVKFIVSVLNIVIHQYRNADVFSMLKTGMSDIDASEYEELENYAVKYKIKGYRWQKPFLKGVAEYGEALAGIEESRRELTDFVSKLEEPFSKAKTVRQKIEALYGYLHETVNLPKKLAQMEQLEIQKGLHEFAEETAQTWKRVIHIFDQLVEIMGDEEINAKDFAAVLQVGFESVELGLLPPTSDGLILGTMQRMRTGRIKALLIIGANEGILPMAMAKEGLLNDDEKNWLVDQNIEICRREELRLREEKIAIYKNMSRPEQFLWVSHSIADSDGGKLSPSFLFEKLKEIFPSLDVQKDIINQTGIEQFIQSKESTLLHMANAMRESITHEKKLEQEWTSVADWYKTNNNPHYTLMVDGLFFKNSAHRLGGERTKELYQKDREDLTLSPSRLEKYGKCPFSFFMGYGLNPEEMRVFEIAGREIGDIYHNMIMRLSKHLTERSRWMDITKEECDALIDAFIDEEVDTYREGMLSQGAEEVYRTGRIKDVCRENAWILIQHVRSGNIASMRFEQWFGRQADKGADNIPPIEIEISAGRKVLIEGKIDRVDILADGSVKVIDYKSGKEKFNADEAKAGFRLQLMLYLKAAQKQEAEPAGVFYFTIDEKVENGRMDGVVVNKASVIDNIAGDFQKRSNIIPVQKLNDGTIKGNSAGNLLTESEFQELQDAVDKKVRALCNELIDGCIDIRPKKSGDITACTYCGYKSICAFDTAFDGYQYENV
ncbi:MAG: PD-(D/E)XK nuclease family protein [Clostridiales bacterium]|nr:PD-(D/E)XK nuclease family protein [Clostridiales bacterium]